jgi:tetratricopeptide (TPR) repeat protein
MQLRSRVPRNAWLLVPGVVVAGLVLWLVTRPRANPDRVWTEAEAELRAGRIDGAESALAHLSGLRVPTPLDWFLRGQVASARRRDEEAVADLAHVPADHAMAAQARLFAGQIELRRFRGRAAERLLLEACRLDPRLVQAHRELIYLYGQQLRRRELGAQFQALSALTPLTSENVFHWCLTRNVVWEPEDLAATMSRFVAADPDDRWSRLALAAALRQLGRLDEAARTLAPLPEADPDARAARVRLALARGDDQAAETLANQRPDNDDHADLARLRGRIALARRNPKAALRHFQTAYRLEPDDRDTLFGLAGALTMLGDHDAARPYLTLARDHDRLGTLMQQIMVESNREDPELMRQLGAACEAIHRLPEARAWYSLVIARNPLDRRAQQALHRLSAASAKTGAGT